MSRGPSKGPPRGPPTSRPPNVPDEDEDQDSVNEDTGPSSGPPKGPPSAGPPRGPPSAGPPRGPPSAGPPRGPPSSQPQMKGPPTASISEEGGEEEFEEETDDELEEEIDEEFEEEVEKSKQDNTGFEPIIVDKFGTDDRKPLEIRVESLDSLPNRVPLSETDPSEAPPTVSIPRREVSAPAGSVYDDLPDTERSGHIVPFALWPRTAVRSIAVSYTHLRAHET